MSMLIVCLCTYVCVCVETKKDKVMVEWSIFKVNVNVVQLFSMCPVPIGWRRGRKGKSNSIHSNRRESEREGVLI